MKKILYTSLIYVAMASFSFSQESEIKFTNIDKKDGKPLMEIFNNRRTTREFLDEPISEEVLGNLLWATAGANRGNGKRTYPAAMNIPDVDLYVIKNDGVWFYDPLKNTITKISTGNEVGAEQGVVELIYVADLTKTKDIKYSYMHAGSMYQNAGLFCASQDLGNVVKGSFKEKDLIIKLKLNEKQKILITQKIGLSKQPS